MKWHLFHRWSKWEPYVWHGTQWWVRLLDGTTTPKQDVTEDRQKRRCTICGITQDVLVRR